MKFNILEIYVMYQQFLVQVTLQSMHRKHMKKLDIHVTNVKFSVISVPSYYSLELLALENKEPQYIIEFAINVLIEPDKKFT